MCTCTVLSMSMGATCTVPLKGKLTVSTRYSKLNSHVAKVETFEFRDARIEDRGSRVESRERWTLEYA